MASHQYRPANSPITENEHEGEDVNYYLDSEEAAPSSSCFCFHWWNRGDYRNTHRPLLDGDGGHQQQQQWWKVVEEKLMKVREVSEVVAGPKWKTFIRKIGGVCRKNRRAQRGQFGYDAEGYALNFDGGLDWEDEDDDGQMYNARSSRFTGSSLAINSSE